MRKQHLHLRELLGDRRGRVLYVRVIGGSAALPVRGATSLARELVERVTTWGPGHLFFDARNGLENELGSVS